MTKILIIIDDENSLKGLTCTGINAQELIYEGDGYLFEPARRIGAYQFTARNVIADESPQLISIPDELLIRIRDHNIDVEHQNAINETCELTKKIVDLKAQVADWETCLALVIEEWERYNEKIDKIIDKYPGVAAEIALEDGDLDTACYFAKIANEGEE